MILAEIYGKLIKGITARVFPHLQIGLMNRLLRVVVVGSLLGQCIASPAPDGTTSETTTIDLPTYVDTIQSIQCIDGSKIRLSF
jgi:hypothetical protein